MTGRSTRRAFLQASGLAAAGGGSVVLTACGSGSRELSRLSASARAADIGLLNRALDSEHRAIAAYTAGLPLLPPRAAAAAKQFLAQELAHASGLSGLVKRAGGRPHQPSPSYDLGDPRTATDVLTLIHGIEAASISLYVKAVPSLAPGSLRAVTASILANEAQHVSIIRSLLGLPPMPSAFVTASE